MANIARVAVYRLLGRSGYFQRVLPPGESYAGPFFTRTGDRGKQSPETAAESLGLVLRADRVLAGELPFYAHTWRSSGFPPHWGTVSPDVHWAGLDEFASGDIKAVWEPSRFDGLVFLAQAYCCTQEVRFLAGCEAWMSDWVATNPWNCGPNWKCAQETGLRLMRFILVSDLLQRFGSLAAAPAGRRFVQEHARRIAPTMLYAIAQDNNHATSEAAALYVAGSFMRKIGFSTPESERWRRGGRKHLEARIARLVLPDGSFSQNSLNYHRLMLDTLSYAETWRRNIADVPFSPLLRERMEAATHWLEAMIDPDTGDGPNLGANDGARFLPLGLEPYRDYRPSVLLASRLFRAREAAYSAGVDAGCRWLGVSAADQPAASLHRGIDYFGEGGYVVVPLQRGKLVLRLPHYRFRPSHADALHVDLWWGGNNLLRDGGTFSYNAVPDRMPYFAGTEAHNTIEFDSRSQMPRLSRFLFGAWLSGWWRHGIDGGRSWVEAGYRDWCGASHVRRISTDGASIRVEDQADGFVNHATLRWRLAPGDWSVEGNTVRGARASITVTAGKTLIGIVLAEGYESRHYDELAKLPVIEAVLKTSGTITTEIELR